MNASLSVVVVSNDGRDKLLSHLRALVATLRQAQVVEWEIVCVLGKRTNKAFTGCDLNSFSDSQITWVSELVSGIYTAMNVGFLVAQNDYVLFINCGDVLLELPDLLHDDKVNCYPVLYGSAAKEIRYPDSNSYLMPHHQGSFFPRSLYKIMHYDDSFRLAGDFEYYLRNKLEYKRHAAPVVARFELGGASMRTSNKLKRVAERYRAAIKHKQLIFVALHDFKKLRRKKFNGGKNVGD